MELIDIIKSSIILFSVSLIIVLIISFGIFKIRNQAKKKNVYRKKQSQTEIMKTNKTDSNQLYKPANGKSSLNLLSENYSNQNQNKFEVINKKWESNLARSFRVNYHPNVYKYYEEFNSKIMFKIKPEI